MHQPTLAVSAILLAAGRSSRMGESVNKLLLPWGPVQVVEAVVDTILKAGLQELIVVVGHQRELVAAAAKREGVTIVANDQFEEGLSTSIRAGLEIASASGYLFLPADMPCVKAATVRLVCERLCSLGDGAIVLPSKDGRRGNPVGFSSSYREELLGLSGDRGARGLVAAYGEQVDLVDVDDDGIFQDLDTTMAYDELRRAFFS